MINRNFQIVILALLAALPASCALAMVIAAKYIALNSTVSAQQETKLKFRPAGPNAKNPRPDEWEVSFKESLSTEECDREIDRILLQYDVKLMHRHAPDDDKPARYPHFHGIYIKASAERAKQIAEDEAVESVTQNQEVRTNFGPTLSEGLRNATPSSNVEPVKGKQPKPGHVPYETKRKDKP